MMRDMIQKAAEIDSHLTDVEHAIQKVKELPCADDKPFGYIEVWSDGQEECSVHLSTAQLSRVLKVLETMGRAELKRLGVKL